MEQNEKQTFEQAMERLEQIVRQLESGNGALDEMLTLYEEASVSKTGVSKLLTKWSNYDLLILDELCKYRIHSPICTAIQPHSAAHIAPL